MILNNLLKIIKKKISHFYLNSNLYNKRITPTSIELIEYHPSPSLLDGLITVSYTHLTLPTTPYV